MTDTASEPLNSTEEWWYRSLSRRRSPEGYKHCSVCDSQRPTHLFSGSSASCVDCKTFVCSARWCRRKLPKRELSRDGVCVECVEKHNLAKNSKRRTPVVDGYKECTKCNTVKDVSTSFYKGKKEGSYNPWCKECCKESTNKNRKPGVRGSSGKKATATLEVYKPQVRVKLRNEVRLLTRLATGNLVHATALESSTFDWSISKRDRYLKAAPKQEYDPLDILDRDGWVCQLCCTPIPRDVVEYGYAPTIDHIVPVVSDDFIFHGDVPRNVQAAHRRCNSIKGNKV